MKLNNTLAPFWVPTTRTIKLHFLKLCCIFGWFIVLVCVIVEFMHYVCVLSVVKYYEYFVQSSLTLGHEENQVVVLR